MLFRSTFAKKAEERTIKKAFNKDREDLEEAEEQPKTKEEEELDIPAFLRKKLKNR